MPTKQEVKPVGGAPAWMATYSDAMTLLMAFFVLLLTFATQQPEQFEVFRRSLIGGQGGTGATRKPAPGPPRDSIIWRTRPPQSRKTLDGSEMPPLYRDPSNESSLAVLQALNGPVPGTLRDSYVLQVPSQLLFRADGKLSSAGSELLGTVGGQLVELPYDVSIQVGSREELPGAIRVCQYFSEKQLFHPGRLGVGVRPAELASPGQVWITLTRRP